MPGAVQAANPIEILPFSLAVLYTEQRAWEVLENRYLNGEVQNNPLVATSRLTFTIQRKLTVAQHAALLAFYLARNGPQVEFYFYNPPETDPPFTYDVTAASPIGRYNVRFDGALSSTLGIVFSTVPFTLVQVS